MRIRVVLSEAWRSLMANVSTTVAATMTVLIGMFLLGLFVALGTWVISWSDHVKRNLVAHVYFCTDATCNREATQQQINAVIDRLDGNPMIKRMRFVTKEEALKIMKQRQPDLATSLSSNPLPASEEIVPRRAEDLGKIANLLKPLPPGVQKVNYGKKQVKQILRVAKAIEVVFLVAVLILIVASTLLIANTIRLSIFSRRREIEVMKLVGATNWFVRGPFMLEGLACGLFGALGAVLLLLVGKIVAGPAILNKLNSTPDVHAWSFSLTTAIIFLSALLLGAAGSGLTIRRFLRI